MTQFWDPWFWSFQPCLLCWDCCMQKHLATPKFALLTVRWVHQSGAKLHYLSAPNNRLQSHYKEITQVRTLYNVILRIARNLLKTSENIKISTHPFYHRNLDCFSWEWSKKKFKMADFSKWPFFKIANSQKFFAKISQIGPWVGRIDWCEAH